ISGSLSVYSLALLCSATTHPAGVTYGLAFLNAYSADFPSNTPVSPWEVGAVHQNSSSDMKNKKGRLFVVGGGSVADDNGIWYAPTPIASYMNELASYFDECTWLIRKDLSGVGVFEGT